MRQSPQTYNTGPTTTATTPGVSYTISDMCLLTQVVEPPQAYIDAMMKKASSGDGIAMDTQCYEVFRHNQAGTTGTTHCLVPSMSKRARSIICPPLDGAATWEISKQPFRGIYDNALAYQWTFGTQQMPSREVDMGRPQPYSCSSWKRRSRVSAGLSGACIGVLSNDFTPGPSPSTARWQI